MKVIHKIFVIALLLSLIFSVAAISAQDIQENMTFEQSDIIDEVSTETLSVSSENQEIEAVEEDSSVNGAEDNNEFLHSTDDNQLNTGNEGSFSDIRNMINNAISGQTIFLDGKTYIGDKKDIDIHYKNLTIVGGSKLNDGKYATLDAKGLSGILDIKSGFYNNCTIVLDSIIFTNANYHAVRANSNLEIKNCYFTNNAGNYSGAALSYDGDDEVYSDSYYDGDEDYWRNSTFYNLNVYDSYFINNHANSQYCSGGAVYFTHDRGYGYQAYINGHFYSDYRELISIKRFVNCVFKDNSATYRGGAIGAHGCGDIINCTFINNNAEIGGAIWALHDVNVTSSQFINNTAFKGGGVHVQGYPVNVSHCNFTTNHATHGGGIYTEGYRNVLLNNEFTKNTAQDSSSAIFIEDSRRLTLKGNKVNSDKTEIIVGGNSFSGLSIVILENKTAVFCEGKIKIYAYVTDDVGNKFSSENFTFLVGTERIQTKLKDSYAEIEYDATLQDTGKKVTIPYNVYDTNNIYPAILEIIPYAKEIQFEDVTGYVGKNIQVPVRVCDAAGHPLEGRIRIIYNGNDFTLPLTNGHKDVIVSLPNEVTTFELTIEYDDIFLTRQVNVVQAPLVVPVITIPETEHGYVGRTITVPVSVNDEEGNPLDGQITVSYNGQGNTLTLINGGIDVQIGLPVYETFLEVSFSYNGKSAICLITVTKPVVETTANINLPHNVSGEIGKSLIVPVSITDKNGNPLSGDIIVSYYGNERTQTFTNGQTNITMSLPQHETSFELVVDYMGNIASCIVEVIDPTNHTDVVIGVDEKVSGNVGSNIVVPVNVTDSKGNALKGDITVYYNGQEKTFLLVEGRANAIISLPAIESTFDLIINYKGHIAISSVEVIGTKPHTVVPVVTLPENRRVEIGKTIVIPVEIHDTEGNPLEGEMIVFYNNQEKPLAFINGSANIIIGSQQNPTTFEVTVVYENVMKHCTVEVFENKPIDEPTVIITLPKNESGHVGHTIVIPVTVFDDGGNALEGDILAFYDGHEKTETLHNGHANVIMELPNAPTTFDLTINYNGVTKTCLITVLEANIDTPTNDTAVVIELEQDVTGYIGKNIMVPVNIHDFNGNALEGDVIIIYNGHERRVTLRDGVANVLIGLPVHPTTFELSVMYEEFIKTTNIIVVDPNNPMGNITEAEAKDDGSVVIPFPKDANGNVTVNIGGKNYTGQIVDGKVVLDVKDLPAGNYESTVYYSGGGNYPSSSKTIVIVVKESNNSNNGQNSNPVTPPAVTKKTVKITAKKKTFKKSVKVKKYSIILKSGKTPLKKVQVTIKVGKKTYKAKTNAKGKATFKIKKLTKKANTLR